MGEAAISFAAGDRITSYEILGLAGAGGMGVVYKAFDTRLERVVALKFLPPDLTFSEKDRKRLLHEAKSASALDHPNIGVIHTIENAEDGRIFIVMAYYDGDTLSHRIASGPLSLIESVDIACQVAQGLGEAHRHGILHRDIKPSNILLTAQRVAKIVDFGLALIFSEISATRSLGVHGTAVYMAPEQIQRVPPDQRSDIWALGVVLAEMLLGHHPFLRENWGATIYAILNDPPHPLDAVPQDLQSIALHALAKNPEKRYQSCDALFADLDRFRDRLKVAPAGPNDPTITSPWVSSADLRRYAHHANAPFPSDIRPGPRWKLWLAVASVLLALSIGVWFSPFRPWIDSHVFRHRTQSTVYETYLAAVNYVRRYDKKGNLDLAITDLRSAVARDPKFALGFAELAEAYRLKYQQDHDRAWLDQALEDCKSALNIDGSLSAVYATLGRIHSDSGNHDLALTEFRHALDLDPLNADALTGIAYAQETTGQIAEAENNYSRALALRPDYWDSYNTLGLFYYRQHRLLEAAAQLKKAVELTPDNSVAYDNLAAVYLSAGTPEDLVAAEQALQKSIAISPNYASYTNLGYLYLQQERYADAAAMTEKAVQLNDKDFLVWENLDWAYRSLGQNRKGETARNKVFELLQQAAKSRPRDAQVQAHLALQYSHHQSREQALDHIQTALALAPKDPDVLANVSDTYSVLGDHKSAVRYAQLSLQNGNTLADLRRDPDMRDVVADPEFQAVTSGKSQ